MFGKRFNILSIAGIKIGIDVSWFFIAFILAWSLAAGFFPFYYKGLSVGTYWLMGILGMVGLFICVILHELSHALVARSYGLPISQITLFIFGGVAEIQKEPTSPKVEFWMAIAGPICSFILAFIAYLIAKLGFSEGWSVVFNGIFSYLAWVNLILAIFNLLPAFPLDGGRVLRAILWGWKRDLSWATNVASSIGSGFGLALIFLGIWILFLLKNFLSGFWLIILGWFLYRAATSMRSQYYLGRELEGVPVAKFMKKEVATVPPETTIQDFIDHQVYQTHHHLYPVTRQDELLGYISLQEIKKVPKSDWGKQTVESVMVPRPQVITATPTTHALDALNLIQQSHFTTLLIVEGNKLVGILTAQDLFKIISLKLELEG